MDLLKIEMPLIKKETIKVEIVGVDFKLDFKNYEIRKAN